MNAKDQFIGAFDSILLALLVVWGITFAGALIHPQTLAAERTGVVEIYALARVDIPGA